MPKRPDRGLLLFEAAQRGDIALVEELLREGADPSTHSGSAAPLVIAADKGHIDIVRLLIQAGANINDDQSFYPTALICASIRGYAPIVRLLLDAGADTSLHSYNPDRGFDEGTALAQALKIEKSLQSRERDLHALVPTDYIAVLLALLPEQQRNSAEIVQMLRQAGTPEE
jgi:ankyrin repeat protein